MQNVSDNNFIVWFKFRIEFQKNDPFVWKIFLIFFSFPKN